MWEGISQIEQEKLRDVINRLLAVNFLLKENDRERFQVARRHCEGLDAFFRLLGWEVVVDDRHECIYVTSPESIHRRNLSRDESLWLLVLRLIYHEKRQGLSLSEFPETTLYEIRAKYDTFRLPFLKKTRLIELVRLATQYQLIQPMDQEVWMDEARFRLFHTLLHAINAEQVDQLHEKITRYELGEEGLFDEVDEEAAAD
ncbi:DUF4194 domain-containing protein [Heliophilum fasciatum]|uniref:Uncharacterized protein DUF4194 n=1 Tax=Heliophilum fasciatum TaxID=35700 RepID=A0A4R2RLU8_9FIRM|nr:DUF4194 domain-containing protein [Heliophilum fasciatum]MCW2278488.1 hypothetical protein [Heliophilum fasciatum]TCP63619.1 uncharacterized protein DUF4194 [Heliophilum fasciatum]